MNVVNFQRMRVSTVSQVYQLSKHKVVKACQGFSLASAIGHSPKIVPDVREFAVQLGQFVRDDFRKRMLYG